ncbi:acyl-CoA thioester hydrolase/BAAT C-terminal domain-containing protein [Corynebacterium suedekumii]|nr:acyl-CoA thioester hydrolase/BAAT C-terminal domain-containing protein [Corynebacterium suedekumii]
MTDHQLADGPLTVLGSSKGAELTANLAARYPEIDHIVLYSPSEYTYAGAQYDNRAQSSSYTWHGTPVPLRPLHHLLGHLRPHDGPHHPRAPVSHRARYEEAASAAASRALNIATPLNRQAATGAVPESRINLTGFTGDGLLFAGDMDAAWPSDTAAHALPRDNPRLETFIFDSAGHHFHENISELGLGWKTTLGGTVNGNRLAKQESDLILTDRLARWHDR